MYNQIVNGDCLQHLKTIPDNTFDICFTSPPYGDTGKREEDSHKKYLTEEKFVKEKWLEWQIQVIDECLRVCKKYIIYNVGAIKENRSNVYKLIGHYADRIHDDIIWYKPNGQPSVTPNVINNTYEHILLIKKDKNLQIKTSTDSIKCFRNVVVFNVNTNNPYSDIHSAIMPQVLSDMMINSLTNKEDFILEPFLGLGTTAISCIKYGRKYYGIELCKEYFDIASRRISDAQIEKNSEFDFMEK